VPVLILLLNVGEVKRLFFLVLMQVPEGSVEEGVQHVPGSRNGGQRARDAAAEF
jgi:hypothetical protein